jgi:PAS domain S-box-containing protein
LETDAIVNEALKKLVDLMSIDMAGIRLTSEAKLRLAFAADCKVSYLEEMAEGIGLEDPALKPVFEERRPITLDRYPHNGGRKRDGRSECFAIVPVASKGTVHGILLVHKEAVSPFSLDEIELFTTVGNQIGIAVDNSWLYQELKKQYIFTTMLIDTMPDGMGVLDERGRVEFANRRLLQLLGYSLQESLGTHWTSLIHPSDHSLVRAQRRSRKSARPSTYECRVLRRNGDAIPVLISWAPRLDGKRQYQGAIGIVTDITERKEAEEALREYEARYVHLVDHMPDGVALVSRRRIIRVNPSMAQLFGFPSPDSMQGLRATDLAAPASKGIMNKRSTLRTLGKKGRNCFEFQALRKDGSTFPAEVTLTVDRSERRPFVLAIIRDVSERKTHERLRKRLSGRILTAQEKERALIARELHDELGQALTGIKMDMSWIKRRVKGADDAISNRFEDLGNLIDTAIDSVRKMASNLRPSVLDKLGLMAAVEWYAAEFERRTGIECTVRAKPSISNIGENLAINAYRIVQEALTNVARHSGASHVDVEIAQHQRHLAISISDNGRGIPSQRGSGWKSLGIENMRERAELLRGKLDIKRRRPRGTKVSAYFPLPSGQE